MLSLAEGSSGEGTLASRCPTATVRWLYAQEQYHLTNTICLKFQGTMSKGTHTRPSLRDGLTSPFYPSFIPSGKRGYSPLASIYLKVLSTGITDCLTSTIAAMTGMEIIKADQFVRPVKTNMATIKVRFWKTVLSFLYHVQSFLPMNNNSTTMHSSIIDGADLQ